jgi:hypothetical protein
MKGGYYLPINDILIKVFINKKALHLQGKEGEREKNQSDGRIKIK